MRFILFENTLIFLQIIGLFDCFSLFSYKCNDQILEIIFHDNKYKPEYHIWDEQINEKSGILLSFKPLTFKKHIYSERVSNLSNKLQRLFLEWLSEIFTDVVGKTLKKIIRSLLKKDKNNFYNFYDIEHQILRLYIHDCFIKFQENLSKHIMYYLEEKNTNDHSLELEHFDNEDLELGFKSANENLRSKKFKTETMCKSKSRIKTRNIDIILDKIYFDISTHLINYFESIDFVALYYNQYLV